MSCFFGKHSISHIFLLLTIIIEVCILSRSAAGHARDCNPGPELTSHPATHVKQTQGYTTLTKTLKNNKHQVETYLKFFTYTNTYYLVPLSKHAR